MITHLVRIGFTGGVYQATYERSLPRGTDVLVRTPHGVQQGEILAVSRLNATHALSPGAAESKDAMNLAILRPINAQDRLLIKRLNRYKVRAVRKCQQALINAHSPAQLLDVDQLLNGGTLILHFLGQPSLLDRQLTDLIVQQYEAEIQSIPLSERLQNGCGEGCGTSAASGCGGSCTACSLASRCHDAIA